MSWYWKSDLRLADKNPDAWTLYGPNDIRKIETAYQKGGKKVLKLNATYYVDFKNMIQYRADNDQNQRPIKREEAESSDEERTKGPSNKRKKTMEIDRENLCQSLAVWKRRCRAEVGGEDGW
eukprot:Sspe_Gene.80298::Locus_50600_Transcript_2_2_Confidence_0.667_Length_837::g.80298::m.80298